MPTARQHKATSTHFRTSVVSSSHLSEDWPPSAPPASPRSPTPRMLTRLSNHFISSHSTSSSRSPTAKLQPASFRASCQTPHAQQGGARYLPLRSFFHLLHRILSSPTAPAPQPSLSSAQQTHVLEPAFVPVAEPLQPVSRRESIAGVSDG